MVMILAPQEILSTKIHSYLQTKLHTKTKITIATIRITMAAPLPPSLQTTTTTTTTFSPHLNPVFRPSKPSSFTLKSSSSDDQNLSPSPDSDPSSTDADPFESRLAQVRLRYRSGTGKKAEVRKEKKVKKGSGPSTSSTKPGSVLLPPVPLKEPVSSGLKVEFGFSPYSERVNGRLAGLGLAALVLVELASGKSVVKYHKAEIVFVQLYFMAAVCAVYLKYEKEKVSVWPVSSAPVTNDE